MFFVGFHLSVIRNILYLLITVDWKQKYFDKNPYVKTEEKLEKVANFIFGRNTLRPYTIA